MLRNCLKSIFGVIVVLILALSVSVSADPALILRIKKSGLKISNEVEGLYQVGLKKRKLKLGGEYLIVRLTGNDEFELLAQGTVAGNQGKIAFIKLDEENMFKKPSVGDYIIPITEGLDSSDEDGKIVNPELVEEELVPDEPGYIQLGVGYSSGSYNTKTDNLANSAKNVGYKYFTYDLKWYVDFAWRFGLQYLNYSDAIPTSTFDRRSFNSNHNYSELSGLFRLRKWGKSKWRSSFMVSTITDEFNTDNKDEFLLSTKFSSLGVGTRLAYEFNDDMWKPNGSGFVINSIYIKSIYLLSVDAEDQLVSRGTDSESNLSFIANIGANFLFYWEAIPVAKRWFLKMDYKIRSYDLTFSGPTVGEDIVGGYQIPENGSYNEVEETFTVMIGIRLDDYIGKFFKPR